MILEANKEFMENLSLRAKLNARRASYSKGLIYLKAIFRQYIVETKRTQSMGVLKNAGIEDSTLLRHAC